MPPLPSASRGSTYKTYAHLTVLSDEISPDELEARIGLRPDVAWAKGEPARGGKRQQ